MTRREDSQYESWLLGQALLLGLLGATLALFVAYPSLRSSFSAPQARLVLDTTVTAAAVIVAVLAGVRFSLEGRWLELLLCGGFWTVAVSNVAFVIAPVLGGSPIHRVEAWANVAGKLIGWSLLAAAPFVPGRVTARRGALLRLLAVIAVALAALWAFAHALGPGLPPFTPQSDGSARFQVMTALALQALLRLVALVGFGLRFRKYGEDLDRWLALAASLALFAELHYVFTPQISGHSISQGDFLRLLAYVVLLVGVWRAIQSAEFGRAVADERARVAREIHDGLAQYLFAVSTHASMLQAGAPQEETIAQLREAAQAAQQEAKFAVLALSSAGGTAPFDAALRRYVDFLTADGRLEVDLEIDKGIQLAADEQIEIFRIVQEGLANARKHAGARCAEVRIAQRGGERVVTIRDDGAGFDEESIAAGQGLKNMRARSATIGGGFKLRSRPGEGTALEVILRT
ncbi:MAG: ATP-binding protein [Gaiellaceae bacterium]